MIGAWIAIAIGAFTALALALGWFFGQEESQGSRTLQEARRRNLTRDTTQDSSNFRFSNQWMRLLKPRRVRAALSQDRDTDQGNPVLL
jgi:hypothetical protein